MDGLLERLVQEDYGLEFNGQKWARSERHDSLVVDREKQVFYWNSKDLRGDAYIYLTKVRGLSHDSAKEFLKQSGFSGTFIQEIKEGKEFVTYPKLVEVFHHALLEGDKTYFYNRTITDETIKRFELGYNNSFYMIPIYQDRVFKQFQMRRDSPKLIRQYYKGLDPFLFNVDVLSVTNKVYITESPIGALILAQNGLPAVSFNTGCDSFMAEWIKYFTHQKEIFILFDNDRAGDYGAKRTAKILGENRCHIYNFWDCPAKGYALDDFYIDGNTNKQLQDSIAKHGKYSFELEDKK